MLVTTVIRYQNVSGMQCTVSIKGNEENEETEVNWPFDAHGTLDSVAWLNI